MSSQSETLAEMFGEEFAESKSIRGAIFGEDSAQEARLWDGFPYMTPERHVEWLRHFMALEFQLSRLQAGWIPATPKLEWRLELPYFIFEDMQHLKELRARLEEFTKSTKPVELHPQLESLLTALAPADSAATFYKQLFAQVKPALLEAYRTYLEKCDGIVDGPAIYSLRRIIAEKERQLELAEDLFSTQYYSSSDPEQAALYEGHVRQCLHAMGSLTPEYDTSAKIPESPILRPAGPAPALELQDPRLRLSDHFPMSTEECPVHNTLREIVYHNATEWQVIGPMCYAYYELSEMPLEFFIDFSRHIWDECRHSMMGFRRLRELGFSIEDFIWPAPSERPSSVQDYVAMLTLVGEACSFKRKQGSIIPFLKLGDQRSAILPAIDCVDERMHVTYGKKWVPEIFKRFKNDDRAFADIAKETRERFLHERKLLGENDPKCRQISQNLPLFCSAIEFAHLDFTKY